jgi:hypothetical protein
MEDIMILKQGCPNLAWYLCLVFPCGISLIDGCETHCRRMFVNRMLRKTVTAGCGNNYVVRSFLICAVYKYY